MKAIVSGYAQIPILMLASLFNVIVGLISVVYIAEKKTKEVAKISVISAIINIVTHVILIRFIGLFAASISSLIAYSTMAIIRYFDVQKYVKIKIEKGLITKTILILIVVFGGYYYNNFYINIIVLLITVIYSIKLNKKLLLDGIKVVQEKIGRKENK